MQRTLHATPCAPVGQRLSYLRQFVGKLHELDSLGRITEAPIERTHRRSCVGLIFD
jgi:hypothetical protein